MDYLELEAFVRENAFWVDDYPIAARKWFVDRFTAKHTGATDATMRKFVEAATSIVRQRLDTASAPLSAEYQRQTQTLLQARWGSSDELRLRAEIAYGILAVHPSFLTQASGSSGPFTLTNEDLYDFVLKRRYRIVKRLWFDVNPYGGQTRPNVLGIDVEDPDSPGFVYPDVPTRSQYKLNSEVTGYWTTDYPFRLSPQGILDPVSAIDGLFHRYTTYIDGSPLPLDTNDDDSYDQDNDPRNKLGCEAVATIVHLDSLLTASDPQQLIQAMGAGYPNYVSIADPYAPSKDAPVCFLANNATAGSPAVLHVHPTVKVGPGDPQPVGGFIPQDFNALILGHDGQTETIRVVGIGVTEDASPQEMRYNGTIQVERLEYDYARGSILVSDPAPPLVIFFLNDIAYHKALFEVVVVDETDLQVGDHIYTPNHPLHSFVANDEMFGEHCFITRLFSELGNKREISIRGHGMDGTLEEVAEEFLSDLNENIAFIRAAFVTHFRETEDPARVPDKNEYQGDATNLSLTDQRFIQEEGQNLRGYSHHPFKYFDKDETDPDDCLYVKSVDDDGNVEYYEDMLGGPNPLTAKQQYEAEKDTALTMDIYQYASWQQWYFAYLYKLVNVSRDELPAATLPERFHWGIYYDDNVHVLPRFHALERPCQIFNKIDVNWLTYEHIRRLLPIYRKPNDNSQTQVLVIRPRVSFEPDYLQFLRDNGGL